MKEMGLLLDKDQDAEIQNNILLKKSKNKVKVVYPLFIKKTRNNMFKRAVKQDLQQEKNKRAKNKAEEVASEMNNSHVIDPIDGYKMNDFYKNQTGLTSSLVLDQKNNENIMRDFEYIPNSMRNIITKHEIKEEQFMHKHKHLHSAQVMNQMEGDDDVKTVRAKYSYFFTDRDIKQVKNKNKPDKPNTLTFGHEVDDLIMEKKTKNILVREQEKISDNQVQKKQEVEIQSEEEKEEGEDEEGLCFICYANPQNVVFLDCGHGGMCLDCAMDMIKKNNICSLCRETVVQIIEIDYSAGSKNGLYQVLNSYYVSRVDDDNSGKEYANLPPVDPPLNGAENSNIGPANE